MRMRLEALGVAAVLSAVSIGSAAAASDSDLALFGRDPGNDRVFACYTRHYDAVHLAGHPKQNVTDMTLFVASYIEPDAGRQYVLSMGVQFRTAKTQFQVSGACGVPADGSAALGCGIECDGGHIGIRIKNAESILVDIPYGARTWDPASEEEPPEDARFGLDDKLFRLDRTALPDCAPLIWDDADRATVLGGS
ncbi:MAG: hypothetical protein KDJ86_11615 [Bauldia sp.]|uniref:hypothetical protein n=1 Tax=Bauldia sp. TaxID=2575872 RepID=UPI001E0EBC78|nr:hypothetical protein [Bauldia sp.]MCB1496427.1 hypothetical protein [Bauldia sp.]